MKVCFINTAGLAGSTGRLCASLMNEVGKDRGSSLLVAQQARFPESFRNQGFGIFGGKLSYKYHRVATFLDGGDGFKNNGGTRKIIRVISQFRPDIIHIHNVHGTFLNFDVLSRYISERKIPAVYTLHDTWVVTGRCACFFDCNLWKSGCGSCPHRNFYPRSLFDFSKYFFSKKHSSLERILPYTTFVAPSDWLKNIFSFSYPNARIMTIRNGVDRHLFSPSQEQFAPIVSFGRGRKIIGGAANAFNSTKGIDDLCYLASQLDSTKYAVCVLGAETTKEMTKNLLFIKKTSNLNELSAFYNSIDLFVNPSKQDNYPTTHLEALASGTRVLTYHTGGADEMILSRDLGCSVPLRNRVELVKKAVELCLTPSSREFVSKNSHVLDLSDMADQYKQLYCSLVAGEKLAQ